MFERIITLGFAMEERVQCLVQVRHMSGKDKEER